MEDGSLAKGLVAGRPVREGVDQATGMAVTRVERPPGRRRQLDDVLDVLGRGAAVADVDKQKWSER